MKHKLTHSVDSCQILLKGNLIEGAGPILYGILSEVKEPKVIVDLGGIDRINSLGIAEWMPFFVALVQKASVELVNCSSVFIDYANLTKDIVKGAKVLSFYVPMVCEKCEKSAAILMTTDAVQATGEFGDHSCTRCTAALQPEVFPADYLRFLGANLPGPN